MQTTGTGSEAFQMVEQGGDYADQLTQNLENVKLPDGFKIDLYAVVPDARHMAVGPQGIVTFVGTRKDAVWAVTDRNKDRVADEVKRFAPSITFAIPNGVCFSKDGFLFIVEQNRVLTLPGGRVLLREPGRRGRRSRAAGRAHSAGRGIVQPHGARLRRRAGQQALHLARPALQRAAAGEGGPVHRGGHRRHHPHGPRRQEPRGLCARHPQLGRPGFRPGTGDLWFTDNQVDGMGDDIPPGELNHTTGPGQHFGFPWFGGGSIRTNEYKDSEPPADAVPPVVEYTAHAADLGMMFYTGSQFPEKYKGGIFSRPAWLVEPHRAGRRARDVHAGQRGRHGGRAGGLRRRLAHGCRRVSRPAGRRGAASATARSSSPTTSPAPIYRISYGDVSIEPEPRRPRRGSLHRSRT